MMRRVAILFLCASAGFLYAQNPPASGAPKEGSPEAERNELQSELQEAANSAEDTIRILETHLKKYPNSTVLAEVQQLLAKEAIETNDKRRIVLYGTPTLTRTPNDIQLLDRVTSALLTVGGKQNAELALEYAKLTPV